MMSGNRGRHAAMPWRLAWNAMNQSDSNANSSGNYALGHSADELDRLRTQARLIDPTTRRFFREAGIEPGMRVLDVGCGAGDTSLLLAEMVGERGQVVGVDRAPTAIAAARSKVAGRDERLRFLEGDPAEMTFELPFDAVAGRYVLMFQEHPATTLNNSRRTFARAACLYSMSLTTRAFHHSRHHPPLTSSSVGMSKQRCSTGLIPTWGPNSLLPS